MSTMARRGTLPTSLPSIIGVRVDYEGRVWVQRWPRAGVDETVFDVFDSRGTSLGSVSIPVSLLKAPAFWSAHGVVAGVFVNAMTGIQRVGVFLVPDQVAGR